MQKPFFNLTGYTEIGTRPNLAHGQHLSYDRETDLSSFLPFESQTDLINELGVLYFKKEESH